MKLRNDKLLSLNIERDDKTKIAKWLNYTMFEGKKERAEKNFREMLLKLKKRYRINPTELLLSIFEKMDTPIGLVKKHPRSTVNMPKRLSENRSFFEGVNPIVKVAKTKKGIKWHEALYLEVEKVYTEESFLVGRMYLRRKEIYKNRSNALKGGRK